MNAQQILSEATAAGLELFRSGDRLRYRGPREVVQRLRPLLAEHRDELLRLLAEDAEPTGPCPACRSGAYYRDERGGPWRCWGCHPPAHGPVALHVVPGGQVPAGKPQDVNAVLVEAAAAAGMPVARVKAALSAEDLDDIAAGRVGARELRAFAEHLLEIAHGDDGDSAA